MSEDKTGRAVVLARLHTRYERLRELLVTGVDEAAMLPRLAHAEARTGAAGLESVMRAEQRGAPRPRSATGRRRVRA